MSTTETSEPFTSLAEDQTLADTTVALEEHGFSVEIVDELNAGRDAVLARVPRDASVMTNPSVTLDECGITEAGSRARLGVTIGWCPPPLRGGDSPVDEMLWYLARPACRVVDEPDEGSSGAALAGRSH